jgi:hypothetical protein
VDPDMIGPPGPRRDADDSASAIEQMRHVFHELHAAGRHALCAVCDAQYGLTVLPASR